MRGGAFHQLLVYPAKHGSNIKIVLDQSSKQGAKSGHQQSGGNSVSGGVGHEEPVVIVGQDDVIQKIASDELGWNANTADIATGNARRLLGYQPRHDLL